MCIHINNCYIVLVFSSEIRKIFTHTPLRCCKQMAITLYHSCIYSLNVTTSGRNCNTIFDVLTSKMPNADRSKHAFVCVCDFVLIKSELQNNYDRENFNLWLVIL